MPEFHQKSMSKLHHEKKDILFHFNFKPTPQSRFGFYVPYKNHFKG